MERERQGYARRELIDYLVQQPGEVLQGRDITVPAALFDGVEEELHPIERWAKSDTQAPHFIFPYPLGPSTVFPIVVRRGA